MSRIFSRVFAPTLQNTGSTARDHLASERTFLAWLRTGLGFIALGIGVERFSRLEIQSSRLESHQHPTAVVDGDLPERRAEQVSSRPPKQLRKKPPAKTQSRTEKQRKEKRQEELLVTALLGTGTGSILYAAARYFSNFRLMQVGLFKPAYFGAGMLAVTVSALAGGAWVGFATEDED